jgi:YcxB-like protein
MVLSFRYTLTEEEYFQYNHYTTWAAPDKKRYRIRHYLRVLILYSLVAGLYIISSHSEQLLIDVAVFAVIATVYMMLIPAFIRLSIKRRVREILSQPANQHILEPAEVVLMDTGIIDRDELSESRYDWEAIVRKAETSTAIYLYTNSYHAIVIPKRILGGPAEKRELEQLLNRHLSLSSEFRT